MKLPKALIGVGGLSFAVFAFWSVLAPAEDGQTAPESRTAIALADTPFVLRDGRKTVANVMRVAFEPQAIDLSQDAQEPLREVLDGIADGCILSAQVVGAASEHETAPRPLVFAHLLALERADAIAQLVRDSGVPTTVVAKLWTVESGPRIPDSVLWVFSSSSRSACVEPTASFELAAVPPDGVTSVGPASALIAQPPVPRPQRDPSAPEGGAAGDLSPAASMAVAELALTFADNSSYLGASEIARLQRFASRLPSTCGLLLRATVAGGTNADYAAWLAERRMARVAEHLNGVATIAGREYLPDDGSRQVLIAAAPDASCSGATETTTAMRIMD
jgi:hypothetical protein